MMNLFSEIKYRFQQRDALIQLIYINIAFFLLLNIVKVFFLLFNIRGFDAVAFVGVPSDWQLLAKRCWTPITYMFSHSGILHFFFNLLCLYWFGNVFLSTFSNKQLLSLYVFGGLVGAAFFVLAFNIFPYYEYRNGILIGASGAIMAVIVASAVRSPMAEINLFLLGAVQLRFIAIVALLLSFFGLTKGNAGGQLAHLGGAFAGWLFVYLLKNKDKDITAWVTKILDWFAIVFKPRKSAFKATTQWNTNYCRESSDSDFNNKAKTMEEIDRILDKIKASGYESLTSDEKKRLFEQKK